MHSLLLGFLVGAQDRFRHNMARAPNRERVSAVKGDSLLSLAGLVAGGRTSTFDVIYVDGDHGVRLQGLMVTELDPFVLEQISQSLSSLSTHDQPQGWLS